MDKKKRNPEKLKSSIGVHPNKMALIYRELVVKPKQPKSNK